MSDKKYVSYKDFGAAGDGVTNDFFAIRAAHEYANLNGLPVKIDGGEYYIGDTMLDGVPVTVEIMTDVNWGGAKIIIDDTDLSYADRRSKKPIFHVVSEYDVVRVEDTETLAALSGIGEGTKKLSLALGYPALVTVYDETRRVYNRYGQSFRERGGQSSPAREILVIDAEGNISEDTPFMFDYPTVTRAEIIRTDVKPLTLEGGTFITVASRFNIFPIDEETGERKVLYGYFERGLVIERSHTTVKNVTHLVTGEIDVSEEKGGIGGPCYHGFFTAKNADSVTLIGCTLTGRRCYRRPKGGTGGTYDFSAVMVNKIVLIDCKQSNFYVDTMTGRAPTEDTLPENIVLSMADSAVTGTKMCWGIGGSNFCKNMEYYNCTLSRFDAHQGLLNGKLVNSTVTFLALIGKGELLLENVHWLSPGPGPVNNCMLYLRNDYGSTWEGTITLKNCRATVSDGECYLVQHSFINWDYGYPCHFPSIISDGLTLEGRPEGYEISFTSEWKSMTKEPRLHLPDTENVPFENPDGPSDMHNANPIKPPREIRIKNNAQGIRFLMTKGLPFFENTEIEGVTLVDVNERKA